MDDHAPAILASVVVALLLGLAAYAVAVKGRAVEDCARKCSPAPVLRASVPECVCGGDGWQP